MTILEAFNYDKDAQNFIENLADLFTGEEKVYFYDHLQENTLVLKKYLDHQNKELLIKELASLSGINPIKVMRTLREVL